IGKGNVGIDIGTQTIGIASKYDVKLLELAPEINNIETIKRKLLRKLDRQRRINNPNNFNENGTIKHGVKLIWVKSNKYIKTQNELRDIQRKQADIRKQSHNILANKIVGLGDRILVETMNYKGLQKRSQNTTVNEKTGKFNKKKRFGKSLANKAPSMLLTILDNKLKWNNTELYKVNTYKIKASQYNHFDDKYNKKELSERFNIFNIDNEEIRIQRDLYSSFLIMNVKENLEEIDIEKCFSEYGNFKMLHDKEINRLLSSENKKISSMGI
ncbi:transposase, partial [Clostridium tagluense]|nr:transposase [Clostridium tagluense]MCB2338671.1 transposase [Clostridium tagluense]